MATSTERLRRGNRDVLALLTSTYLAAFLIVALPAYVLLAQTVSAFDAETPYGAAWAFQAGVILWAGVRLSMVFYAARIRLMSLGFWTYVYVFLGLAPLAQMYTGSVPGPGRWTADEQITSTLIVLVGLCAYEIGTQIAQAKPRQFDPTPTVRQFKTSRVWILAIIGLGFALIYIALIGPSTFFQLRAERSAQSQASFGGSPIGSVVAALATVPTLIALLGFIEAKKRGEPGKWLIILLLGSVMLLLANPLSSSRFWSGVVIGSIAIVVFNLAANPRRFRVLVSAMLAVFIFAFPYADLFRNEASSAGTTDSFAYLMSDKLDYDSFAQIALTDRYVAAEGHTLGQQILGALTAPVPRDWWPDKPEDTGIVLADFAGYWFTSISAPLWSEAWIDGGWPWLFLVFLGLGWLSRKLDERYEQALRNPTRGVWLAAVPVFALYQVMTLRGSFLQQTPRLVLFILLFWWVSEARRASDDLPKARRAEPSLASTRN